MISVVIPCYNCEAFLKRAVDSVLKQTHKEYEMLLVDNCSTDSTPELLRNFQDQYPSVIKVLRENKKGAPAARNRGLANARGEWIQFLDADDELHPEKLENQLRLAHEGEPPVGVVTGHYQIRANRAGKSIVLDRYAMTDPWEGLITSNLGITSSNLWNKSVLLAAGGWDENLSSSQEYDLLLRILQNGGRFSNAPAVHTYIYKGHSSVSSSTDKRRLAQIVQNRIDLRYRAKEYLQASGKLTKKLSTMIDSYIYYELKRNKREIPEYTNSFMENNMLNVPLDFIIKTNTRIKLKEWFSFLTLSTNRNV